ncbi:hypothetical protein [Myceligenerans crystallogenes]|uniref:Uncharacterized protein n=1 Tax=Myceligenerans crystallogenes TaxID=316335 RepID=A0ABN2N6F4_9MICO
MNHEPSMSHHAIQAVERHVNSARPDAPVVPHQEKGRRAAVVREQAAAALRKVAEKIEPREPARPQCAPRPRDAW